MSDLDSILSRTGHDMVPSDETDVAAILRQRLFTDCDEQCKTGDHKGVRGTLETSLAR